MSTPSGSHHTLRAPAGALWPVAPAAPSAPVTERGDSRRAHVAPAPAPAPSRWRRWLGTGATAVAGAAGLTVATVVLVALRTERSPATGDDLPARLDTALAQTAQADRLLSVASWAAYVTTTLVLGGAIYRLFVAGSRPAGRSSAEAALRLAVVVGLVAVAASIPLRAAVVAGDGLVGGSDPGDLAFVLTSRFGEAALVRVGGLGLLALSLGDGALRRAVCLLGATVLLLSYVLVGHPQATDPVAVEIPAHAVHVAAAATWFGGLAFLAIDLRQQRREGSARVAALTVVRFSEVAELMVVLIVCSGAVLAGGQLSWSRPPWTTGYGQAFLAKIGFVGLVLALGAYNRQRSVPAITQRDDAMAWRRLRHTVAAEAVLIALGVLLMTAVMTSGGF